MINKGGRQRSKVEDDKQRAGKDDCKDDKITKVMGGRRYQRMIYPDVYENGVYYEYQN
jgi:hypothetical protein